jgi:transcriptional regulator with XRE-family HTH domain
MAARNPSDHHDGDISTLGSLLKQKREAAGLTLTRMAAELGITRQYLSRLEQGVYAHPSPTLLLRLAKRFDLRLEDLYAVSGCLLPTDLPNFGPYLRAKYPNWPEPVIAELADFRDFLQQRYSLQ